MERRKHHLNENDQRELYKQRMGYEGEMHFSRLVHNHLPSRAQVLYSILLKEKNSYFQIDSLIFTQGRIILIDTKNFQGDYLYNDQGDFYHLKQQKPINNPIHQLKRCKLLLGEFLQSHQIKRKIEAYVVFVHPKFLLYQAPPQSEIIHPPQLNRFLNHQHQLIITRQPESEDLLQLFRNQHITKNPQEYIPTYSYPELRKGFLCLHCSTRLQEKNRVRLACPHCGQIESIESCVMRTTVEFAELFPKHRIKPISLHHWYDGMISMRRILRILHKYMKAVGTPRKTTYFEFY